MKMFISTLLVLALVMECFSAMAEDTGVQVIGGPETEVNTVKLDDFKKDDKISIPGFAEITLCSIEYVDVIETSYTFWSSGGGYAPTKLESGSQAQYLVICLYILNTQKVPFNFKDVFGEVICEFDNDYQFGGWSRQERKIDDRKWVMYPESDDSYAISSLYGGYFDIVVTLPNYVVNEKKPLSVCFLIGDSEFTVNVRK